MHATRRVARADLEIGGHTIRAGQQVTLLLGAANHDPARFADPGRLELGREPNPHLAFGSGIHSCRDVPRARLAGQIAITTLVQRMPELALAPARPEHRDNYVPRGFRSLPVTF